MEKPYTPGSSDRTVDKGTILEARSRANLASGKSILRHLSFTERLSIYLIGNKKDSHRLGKLDGQSSA